MNDGDLTLPEIGTKRLIFAQVLLARSGIEVMCNGRRSFQQTRLQHPVEHLRQKTKTLVIAERAVLAQCDNTSALLPEMLQRMQSLVREGGCRRMYPNSHDTTFLAQIFGLQVVDIEAHVDMAVGSIYFVFWCSNAGVLLRRREIRQWKREE